LHGSYWYRLLFQAGVIEEIVNDVVDSALDSEDIEDEIEEEVDKALTAIAGETAAQLPEAVRKQKVKQPAQSARAADEVRAIRFLGKMDLVVSVLSN
jgi:charged multivesicular body protein 3